MINLKYRHTIFKILILLTIFFSSINNGYSQEENNVKKEKYKLFLPDYVKLQYAGGIGFMSLGLGYTFFKDRLDITMFYGYVPKAFSSDDLHSISLQLTGKLLKFKLNDKIELLPLNFGWYAHHTFGHEYWIKLPDYYPDEYYWWSPGRNAGIFIGAEVKTKLFASKTPASGTAFYLRVGTRGLYLSSIWGNSTIPIKDIVELGFGIAIYR